MIYQSDTLAESFVKAMWWRRAATILLLALRWPPAAALAETPSVQIPATDPGSADTLHRGDALSVRLAYRSAIPLRFQIEGYASGVRVGGARSNPVPTYRAGEGEAITWLALDNAAYMDEVL
jgi:hypothetical protein